MSEFISDFILELFYFCITLFLVIRIGLSVMAHHRHKMDFVLVRGMRYSKHYAKK